MPVHLSGRTDPQPERLKDSSRGQVPAHTGTPPTEHGTSTIQPTLNGLHKRHGRRKCAETLFDPFRVAVFNVALIRWRRPPSAALPPSIVWQAFSLQDTQIRPSRSAGVHSRSCVEQLGREPGVRDPNCDCRPREGHRYTSSTGYYASDLAITMRWISLVPSYSSVILASRRSRSTGYSLQYPYPPNT